MPWLTRPTDAVAEAMSRSLLACSRALPAALGPPTLSRRVMRVVSPTNQGRAPRRKRPDLVWSGVAVPKSQVKGPCVAVLDGLRFRHHEPVSALSQVRAAGTDTAVASTLRRVTGPKKSISPMALRSLAPSISDARSGNAGSLAVLRPAPNRGQWPKARRLLRRGSIRRRRGSIHATPSLVGGGAPLARQRAQPTEEPGNSTGKTSRYRATSRRLVALSTSNQHATSRYGGPLPAANNAGSTTSPTARLVKATVASRSSSALQISTRTKALPASSCSNTSIEPADLARRGGCSTST